MTGEQPKNKLTLANIRSKMISGETCVDIVCDSVSDARFDTFLLQDCPSACADDCKYPNTACFEYVYKTIQED